MIKFETSLKIYFVLLTAEAKVYKPKTFALSYELIKHTQNLVFRNVGNKDGRISVLSLS